MPQPPINRREYLKSTAAGFLTGATLLCHGCFGKTRKDQRTVDDLLSKPRASENSTVLEFATVTIVPYRNRLVQETWNQVDQQSIDLEMRKTLTRNGIRVGIAGQALPPALRALLKPKVTQRDSLTAIELEMVERGIKTPEPVLNSHTRITMLPDQSRDLPLVDARPELAWQWNANPGIQHQRVTDAVSMVRATISPTGPHSISIGLIPLLKHGKEQPQFNALNEQLAFQVSQSELLLSEARMSCELRCGETLVVGPADGRVRTSQESASLGEVFFARQFPEPSQTLVLLRLLDSNTSELFS